MVPTCTLPRLRLVGFAASWPGGTAVPESPTVRVEFDALEVTVTFPLTLPLEVGENVTLKLTLCPLLRLSGKLKPLAPNPEPVTCAAEMVTPAPLELVRVSERVWEPPT